MRTKQEILKEIEPIRSGNLTMGIDLSQRIIIELLLDIRDSSPHSTGESDQFRQAPKMVRCAKCNNPFENHHHRIPVDGKWYHTGCAEKIGIGDSEQVYNRSNTGKTIHDSAPREEWVNKFINSGIAQTILNPRQRQWMIIEIREILSQALSSEKDRMRVGVENLHVAQIAYSGGKYWIRKDDVLGLIDNRDK